MAASTTNVHVTKRIPTLHVNQRTPKPERRSKSTFFIMSGGKITLEVYAWKNKPCREYRSETIRKSWPAKVLGLTGSIFWKPPRCWPNAATLCNTRIHMHTFSSRDQESNYSSISRHSLKPRLRTCRGRSSEQRLPIAAISRIRWTLPKSEGQLY